MDSVVRSKITAAIKTQIAKDKPKRKALSSRYPVLLPAILGIRQLVNNFKNTINLNITKKKSKIFYYHIIARHSSPLFRKLGDSDPNLQKGKIKNLKIAVEALNGTIIGPDKVFSFWAVVGATSEKKGYKNGMLLSNGKVVEGVGGGLCQLSNLLYWLFLHCSVEIVERKHHSRDVFPDSGRTIPFGTGATIFYNLIDLKVKNKFSYPIQLKLWLTDSQLKGQIVSTHAQTKKYHLKEKEHHFVQTGDGIYRYNEIWRQTLINGNITEEKMILTNCAPVLYDTKSANVIVL